MGKNIWERVFFPRGIFSPIALEFSFEMRRWQFPLKLPFGMTFHKAQWYRMNMLGLNLPTPELSHEKLYVAMSWVKALDAVKVHVKNSEQRDNVANRSESIYTENVVNVVVLKMAHQRL